MHILKSYFVHSLKGPVCNISNKLICTETFFKIVFLYIDANPVQRVWNELINRSK